MSDDRPMRSDINGIMVPLTDVEIAARDMDAALLATPPMPTITAAQLRLALLGLGMTGAQVEAAIGAMPGTDTQREAARIQWEYATTFSRQHPLVVALGAALGRTEAQIDNAWWGASFL